MSLIQGKMIQSTIETCKVLISVFYIKEFSDGVENISDL